MKSSDFFKNPFRDNKQRKDMIEKIIKYDEIPQLTPDQEAHILNKFKDA